MQLKILQKIFLFFKSPKLWKTATTAAVSLIAFAGMWMSILGITVKDTFSSLQWQTLLILCVAAYIVLTLIVYVAIGLKAKCGVSLTVSGIEVRIQQGDIFKSQGWKLIPFNECFDTVVDDKIIAHNSLNGIFITKYVDDKNALEQAISNNGVTFLTEAGKKKTQSYPLGTIKTYRDKKHGDFMLLAFTHFNENNEAHIDISEYENCLRKMWNEISRVYANRPITLPLLGSGITRIDGVDKKDYLRLLKCIICTLKGCGGKISQPITIVLTKEMMQKINIYETKGLV